jgi:phospholipid/cholesterol/gamma-HCH transport system substrate-binding protein
MKKLRERNLLLIAAITTVILLIGGIFALNFARLTQTTYSADLATAVGLQPGDVVTIAGVRVGAVSSLTLDHGVAKATFQIDKQYHLGSTTSVTVKVLNPVGVEYLELTPSGPGNLTDTIPVSRTTVPQTLVSDLNGLTQDAAGTNLPQLVQALQVLTQTFSANTPAQSKAALDGIASLSAVLAADQTQIEQLVTESSQLTGVLNGNSGQLVQLIGQSSLLLQVLQTRQAALDHLLTTTTQLTDQIEHIIGGDRSILDPLLQNLVAVTNELAQQSGNVSQAIPLLAAFSRYSSNVTGSGPYADFVAPSLIVPDNLIDQCAAIAAVTTQQGCRP